MTETHPQSNTENTIHHEHYFPTPITTTDLPDSEQLNQQLLQEIYQWRETSPDGIVRSNFAPSGSWHSDVTMHKQPRFNELTSHILATAERVFQQHHYDDRHPPAIDSMWANINPQHGYNRSHSHPDTLWSGVYYVQAPENCGRISFSDPRLQARVITPILKDTAQNNINSWPEVYFDAMAGRLIIFPGWLVHEVEPNLSNLPGESGNRVSVSFNIYQGGRGI